jgi:hypothetical protein
MKRVLGRQTRRSFGAARKMWVPALATQPLPIVVTGARTKRIMSWMASPDSTCPPGDEISTLIGASDSCASAIRRSHVTRASLSSTSPKTRTKRDLNDSCSWMLLARSPLVDFSFSAGLSSPAARWASGVCLRCSGFGLGLSQERSL